MLHRNFRARLFLHTIKASSARIGRCSCYETDSREIGGKSLALILDSKVDVPHTEAMNIIYVAIFLFT